METVELKRCPFCGNEARLMYEIERIGIGIYEKEYLVKCTYCEATGSKYGMIHKDKEEERLQLAINAWNRRADDERN